jgi:hypothetical protein
MPDSLPTVTETFVADTQPFIDSVLAAADAARDAASAVEELQAAIDALHGAEVTIRVNTEGGLGDAGLAGLGGVAAQAQEAGRAVQDLAVAWTEEEAAQAAASAGAEAFGRDATQAAAEFEAFMSDRLHASMMNLENDLYIQAHSAEQWAVGLEQVRQAYQDVYDAQDPMLAAMDELRDHINANNDAMAFEALVAAKAARGFGDLGGMVSFATAGTGLFATALAATHLLVGAFGANVIADAVGLTAFGVAAVSAIGPVVESLGTLTTSYGTLDNYQKAAALSLQSFLDSMGGNEAQIFTVFNQGLSLIEGHISAAGGVTSQASIAFMDFFAMLKAQFASTGWVDLFSRSTGVIRTDMDAMFGLVNNLLGVIPGLFHDFNGLGLGIINFGSGVLHATAAVLNFDPALTRIAAGVGLFATAWHLAGNNIKWIPAMGPTLKNFASEMIAVYQGARIAGQGILEAGVTAAGALAPLLEIGAAGIAFVTIANALPDPVNGFVSALAQQDNAIGLNVTGYQRLSTSLSAYLTHARQLPADMSPRALIQIAQAQQQAAGTARALGSNFTYLSKTLGLTRSESIAAAQATGVNLRQSLTGSGQAAAAARDKMATYASTVGTAAAVEKQFSYDMSQANDTSLNMTDRLQGLSTAFSVLSGPTLQALGAAAQFKQTLGGLQQAAKAAGDQVGVNTQKQAALSIALATAASAAMKDSTAILNNTHSASAAQGPLIAMRDEILQLGLRGQAAAALVSQLNTEIAALHSKTITITTHFDITGQALGGFGMYGSVGVAGIGGHTGYASGTDYAAAGWHLVGERGPELVKFAGGEQVLNNPHTQAFMNNPGGHGGSSTAGGGFNGVINLAHTTHVTATVDQGVLFETVKTETARYGVRNGTAQQGRLSPASQFG